ncbi:hypothetical protein GCM10009824_22460 [Kocuria atrinae]|uniref:Uncharacterized protein n=1 Tax=Kocuria atrinae TaxID=592377 RepID=A0ABP5JNT4_9MICC
MQTRDPQRRALRAKGVDVHSDTGEWKGRQCRFDVFIHGFIILHSMAPLVSAGALLQNRAGGDQIERTCDLE